MKERTYYYARKIKWYQDANQVQVLEENSQLPITFSGQVKDRMKKDFPKKLFKRKGKGFWKLSLLEKKEI